MVAFTACGAYASADTGPPAKSTSKLERAAQHARVSRRTLACAAATALARMRVSLLNDESAVAAERPPGLPAGAAEFSRVLAARERWAELGGAVAAARNRPAPLEANPDPEDSTTSTAAPAGTGTLDPVEWDSARSYLRAFYSIGTDMRSLARPWKTPLRKRAESLASSLQRTVKAMDVPARERDPVRFLVLHAEAATALSDFFDVFADAVSADIPAEL